MWELEPRQDARQRDLRFSLGLFVDKLSVECRLCGAIIHMYLELFEASGRGPKLAVLVKREPRASPTH